MTSCGVCVIGPDRIGSKAQQIGPLVPRWSLSEATVYPTPFSVLGGTLTPLSVSSVQSVIVSIVMEPPDQETVTSPVRPL